MRITAGGKFGALVVAAMTLGACGGATARSTNPTNPPSTPATTSTTVAATTTSTTPLEPTIPTLPPTSATVPTTLPPTLPPTLPATTTPPPTTVPAATIPQTTEVPRTVPVTHPPTTPAPTTVPPATTTRPTTTVAGPPACQYANLSVSLGLGMPGGGGTAGTDFVDILFKNTGSTTCSLFGYPGVSYVRGSQGTQTGAPAVRDAAISGGSGPSLVSIAPGTTAKAVLGEVDVQNFPAATCRPVATLGLRIYPPNLNLAFFAQRPGTGCLSTSVTQLKVGFIVPPPVGP